LLKTKNLTGECLPSEITNNFTGAESFLNNQESRVDLSPFPQEKDKAQEKGFLSNKWL